VREKHVRKKEIIQVKGDNREKRMTAAKTVIIVNVYPSNVKVINGVSCGNKQQQPVMVSKPRGRWPAAFFSFLIITRKWEACFTVHALH